jgi:hypothetical protein
MRNFKPEWGQYVEAYCNASTKEEGYQFENRVS